METRPIDGAVVRADFNDLPAVVHYTKAAHELGLWASEEVLIRRFFTDYAAPLLEAGCGAGRVTLGLWRLGFRDLTAFDFAEELVDQAVSLAAERRATDITFLHDDATAPSKVTAPPGGFGGALFLFNGLMQIPGRTNRRRALLALHSLCRPAAPLLFTTHDRDCSPTEQALWRLKALRWERGEQDPRLLEFGDRYFSDDTGRTFMHLPDRAEILDDLAATGWRHTFDALRREVARESRAVRDFSDECSFWAAHRDHAPDA